MKRLPTVCSAVLLAFLLSGCFNHSGNIYQQPKNIIYVLNTAKSNESPIDPKDTSWHYSSAISAYIFGDKNKAPYSIPSANAFLCKVFHGPFTSSPDTILLLDTSSYKSSKERDLSIYWVDFVETNSFQQCRIKVPTDSLSKITKYKYQYGIVKLVTDD